MDIAYSMHERNENVMQTSGQKNLKVRGDFGDVGVGERIRVKWVL
jgi:hypothetical protein